jgi:hypothetical protein
LIMRAWIALLAVVAAAAVSASAQQQRALQVSDDDSMNEVDISTTAEGKLTILKTHRVVYSEAPVNNDYKSNSVFNARGMHHVYLIMHAFLDLVQRDDVLPLGVNASILLDTPQDKWTGLMEEHWKDFMLQYIGVLTIGVCGILLALAIPLACMCVCCCRYVEENKISVIYRVFHKSSLTHKRGCISAISGPNNF